MWSRASAVGLCRAGETCCLQSANAIRSLAPVLKEDVESLGAGKVYRDIDLPLVPVLLRMEEAGVRIDRAVLSAMCERLKVEMERVSEQISRAPAIASTSIRPSSWETCCSTKCICPSR